MASSEVYVLREVRRRTLATLDELATAQQVKVPRMRQIIRRLRGAHLVDTTVIRETEYVQLEAAAGLLMGAELQQGGGLLMTTELDFGAASKDPVVPLPPINAENPDATFVEIADAAETALSSAGPKKSLVGFGVALPAPIERESSRCVAPFILPGWTDRDIVGDIEKKLADRGIRTKVTVVNDAAAGARGVHTRAKLNDPASTPENLVYIRLAAGIGAGIIVDGELVEGTAGFAGELGHLKIDERGPLCSRCGGRGCVEIMSGTDVVVGEIVAAAKLGNVKPEKALRSKHPARSNALWSAGWNVGVGIAHACTLLNPEWVVLGGLMSQAPNFRAAVKHAMRRMALPQSFDTCELHYWDGLWSQWSGEPSPDRIDAWDVDRRPSPEAIGTLATVLDRLGEEHLFRAAKAKGLAKEATLPASSKAARRP